MRGRLNIFQATMLRWRSLHPYTGIHVVRVPAPLDRPRLETGIRHCLERAGLSGFACQPQRRRFRFAGGPAAVALRWVEGGADPRHVLDGEIESELNTPFPRDGRPAPFRFFAIDAGDGFHLGLAYDHFVAAADSIVVLLADIVDRYSGEAEAAARAQPLRVYPETYRTLFLRNPGYLLRGLRSLRRMVASCRRSARPPVAAALDPRNGFAAFRIGAPGLDQVTRAARAWGVTLNDLFMAIMLRALAPLAEERRHAPRRTELAVASIMNLRREFQPDARHTFGQFLGSFRVSHPVPAGIGLHEVARDVHAETARIKRDKLYLQNLLALGLVGLAWPFLSPGRRDRFFFKHYPVWAGVTAVNVNSLWRRAAEHAPPLEYLRAGSTGPLAPLVFTITMVGEVLQVGITFRSAVFSREAVDGVAAEFVRSVAALPS